MFIDQSDFHGTLEVQSEKVRDFVMPEARQIPLPAQEWELAAKAYCGDRLSEGDPGDIIPVKEFEHAGFLYAVFACSYGGWSGDYSVQSWQLLPAKSFKGITTGVIKSSEWDQSRARGDMTGLIVSVRRQQMVCSKPVHFIRNLPTVRPLPISQAMDFDNTQRKSGWRALRYSQPVVTWVEFSGHPVAIYEETDEHDELRVLYWKSGGQIQEYFLTKEQLISPVPSQSKSCDAHLEELRFLHSFQASLF